MNQSKSVSINKSDALKEKMQPNSNFKKKLSPQTLMTIFAIFLFLACKSDAGRSDKEPVSITNLKIYDTKNTGGADDIIVEFDKPQNEQERIEEYRIFVAKEEQELTLEVATTLPANFYTLVGITNSIEDLYRVGLATNIDTNGDDIVSGLSYEVYILIVDQENEPTLSQASNSLMLSVTNLVDTVIEGINAGTGGLSLDDDENIYLGNFGLTFNAGGDNVFKITPDGTSSVFAAGLDGAAGNDFDQAGNLYQTNFSGSTISKIDAQGNVEEYIGQTSEINGPVGLIVDTSGNLFITNCSANSVVKVNIDKTIETLASGSVFSCPNGITQDQQGNLYVTNFNNSTIVRITPDSSISTFKTLPGGQVTHPFYSNGFVYAVSRGDLRIYRISVETGEETVVAGSGEKGTRIGAALDAEFVRLNDLVLTPDGNTIYINDTDPDAADAGRLGPVMIKRIRLFEDN